MCHAEEIGVAAAGTIGSSGRPPASPSSTVWHSTSPEPRPRSQCYCGFAHHEITLLLRPIGGRLPSAKCMAGVSRSRNESTASISFGCGVSCFRKTVPCRHGRSHGRRWRRKQDAPAIFLGGDGARQREKLAMPGPRSHTQRVPAGHRRRDDDLSAPAAPISAMTLRPTTSALVMALDVEGHPRARGERALERTARPCRADHDHRHRPGPHPPA